MESSLSAKNIIATILLNEDTEKLILHEYVTEYLKTNPQLISKYIETNGLYHVYFSTFDDDYYESDLNMLVVNFVNYQDALNYVIKNGRHLCYQESRNFYLRATGLTICRQFCTDKNFHKKEHSIFTFHRADFYFIKQRVKENNESFKSIYYINKKGIVKQSRKHKSSAEK